MQIRPIKTKADHRAALKEIERLMDAKPGTPAGEQLEILTTLVDSRNTSRLSLRTQSTHCSTTWKAGG
jgi:HTH-type transcriptional regulator/antitoxin HigA